MKAGRSSPIRGLVDQLHEQLFCHEILPGPLPRKGSASVAPAASKSFAFGHGARLATALSVERLSRSSEPLLVLDDQGNPHQFTQTSARRVSLPDQVQELLTPMMEMPCVPKDGLEGASGSAESTNAPVPCLGDMSGSPVDIDISTTMFDDDLEGLIQHDPMLTDVPVKIDLPKGAAKNKTPAYGNGGGFALVDGSALSGRELNPERLKQKYNSGVSSRRQGRRDFIGPQIYRAIETSSAGGGCLVAPKETIVCWLKANWRPSETKARLRNWLDRRISQDRRLETVTLVDDVKAVLLKDRSVRAGKASQKKTARKRPSQTSVDPRQLKFISDNKPLVRSVYRTIYQAPDGQIKMADLLVTMQSICSKVPVGESSIEQTIKSTLQNKCFYTHDGRLNNPESLWSIDFQSFETLYGPIDEALK